MSDTPSEDDPHLSEADSKRLWDLYSEWENLFNDGIFPNAARSRLAEIKAELKAWDDARPQECDTMDMYHLAMSVGLVVTCDIDSHGDESISIICD